MDTIRDSAQIIHLDMDAFFVAVEIQKFPEYRGKPVAIGARSGRGVLSTASYEARARGVRSGMPVRRALSLCPELILIPHSNMRHYVAISRQVQSVCGQFTPEVQAASIDEFYLRLRGNQRVNSPAAGSELLRTIQAAVRRATGLPASLSLARDALLAKMSVEEAKPAGVFCLPFSARQEWEWLRGRPLADLPGLGPRSREYLEHDFPGACHTLGDLFDFPDENRFPGPGLRVIRQTRARLWPYFERAFGGPTVTKGAATAGTPRGDRGTAAHRERVDYDYQIRDRSISQETTFSKDIDQEEKLYQYLFHLGESLLRRARKKNFQARTLTLRLRFADFETHQMAHRFDQPVENIEPVMWWARRALPRLRKKFEDPNRDAPRKIRLIGWRLSNPLTDGRGAKRQKGVEQMSLFEPGNIPENPACPEPARNEEKQPANPGERASRVDALLDRVQERYGRQGLFRLAARERWVAEKYSHRD